MTTIVCNATKCASAIASNPDTNYDGDGALYTGYNSPPRRSFFEFDLSGIPAGAVINSAYLHVCSYFDHGGLTVTTPRITDNTWVEANLCWNVQPATTTTNQAIFTSNGTAGTWYYVDITNLVKDAWILGAVCGLGLFSPNTTLALRWYSRHGGTVPHLDIDYTYTTYTDTYVNSSTGNDSNAGTSCAAPKKTFQGAYNILSSGGTVHVCNSGADFSGETVTLNKGFSITVDGGGYYYGPKAS